VVSIEGGGKGTAFLKGRDISMQEGVRASKGINYRGRKKPERRLTKRKKAPAYLRRGAKIFINLGGEVSRSAGGKKDGASPK